MPSPAITLDIFSLLNFVCVSKNLLKNGLVFLFFILKPPQCVSNHNYAPADREFHHMLALLNPAMSFDLTFTSRLIRVFKLVTLDY